MIAGKLKIDERRLADLMVGAFEGGSNYWIGKVESVNKPPVLWKVGDNEGVNYYPAYMRTAMSKGGVVRLRIADPDREQHSTVMLLTRAKLERGWSIMVEKYPNHAADAAREDDDATTADVFIQCVIFGEVIYG